MTWHESAAATTSNTYRTGARSMMSGTQTPAVVLVGGPFYARQAVGIRPLRSKSGIGACAAPVPRV